MPIVQVEFLEGRTVEQKRAMADKVTQAVSESLACPPERVKIIMREMKRENFAEGGKLAIDQ